MPDHCTSGSNLNIGQARQGGKSVRDGKRRKENGHDCIGCSKNKSRKDNVKPEGSRQEESSGAIFKLIIRRNHVGKWF